MAPKKRPDKAKRPDSQQATLDAINIASAELRQKIWDVRLRLLAIQSLLQERGIVTAREVEACFEELRERLKPRKEAYEAEMLRILQSYEGRKQ